MPNIKINGPKRYKKILYPANWGLNKMYVPYFETKNFSISLSERPSTNWSLMNSRISFANSESELSMFSFWHTRQRMFELNFLALSSNWELPKISEGSTAIARDAIKKANKIKKKYFNLFLYRRSISMRGEG